MIEVAPRGCGVSAEEWDRMERRAVQRWQRDHDQEIWYFDEARIFYPEPEPEPEPPEPILHTSDYRDDLQRKIRRMISLGWYGSAAIILDELRSRPGRVDRIEELQAMIAQGEEASAA